MIKFYIDEPFEKPSNWDEVSNNYLYVDDKRIMIEPMNSSLEPIEPKECICKRYAQFLSLWLTNKQDANFIKRWEVVDNMPALNPKTGKAAAFIMKTTVYAKLKEFNVE